MNNIAINDGQAPARRIGALIAIIVTCIGCACIAGIGYLFAREGLNTLMHSISLSANGVTTTGIVTDTEEFSSARPGDPGRSYKLIVTFEVAGQAYSIKSNAVYNPTGTDWVGQTMPIIYDPDDPDTALIDTFQERWLEPILNSAP